ncbi:MAG: nucleoside hydrolase [Sphaerochaeta sp.]|jgi:ribosylpyrimidine nucleosidase|nr:nucleoside hydrolase [Sphaerochaeta sp.]
MERIIMDVDTGLDDMVAIMLAAGSPELAIQGIIAAAGNQIIDKTLPNTLNVVQFLGKDIPVYAGSRGPLLRPQQTAGNIHGKDGLGDIPFPPRTKKAEPGYGVFFLIDTIMRHPGEITLVPTGPMTDIALAMRIEPDIIHAVKEIVFMGGSLSGGNITEWAEFNIYADPEAAKIVLSSGAPMVMLGLDATLQVQLSPQRLESLKQIPGKTARQFGLGMDFYMATCMKVIRECPAMHDPCAIAYLLKPELFGGENHVLDVETTDEQKRGEIIDKGVGGMVKVITKVDADGFWPLLEQSLRNLG